jgi:hypothetical protein
MGLKGSEIKNIKKHLRLHIAQNKLLKEAFVFIGIITLFLEVCMLVAPGSNQTNILMGNNIMVFLAIIEVIICYNLITLGTRTEKSMYPGTEKTRFIARIIFDVGIITLSVVTSGIMDIILFVIVKIVHFNSSHLYQTILFSWKEFVMKLIFCFGIMILLYAVVLMFNSLINKLGLIKGIVVYAIILAISTVVLDNVSVFDAGSRIFMVSTIIFGIIIIVISYFIETSVRKTAEIDRVNMALRIVAGVFVGMILIEMMKFSSSVLIIGPETYDANETRVFKLKFPEMSESEVTENVLFKIADIECNDNCNIIKSMSIEEAKTEGITDCNVDISDDELMVVIRNPQVEYELYPDMAKDIIENITVDDQDNNLQLIMPEKMIAMNGFAGGYYNFHEELRKVTHAIIAKRGDRCSVAIRKYADLEFYFIYNENSVFSKELHLDYCRDE